MNLEIYAPIKPNCLCRSCTLQTKANVQDLWLLELFAKAEAVILGELQLEEILDRKQERY